MSIKLVPVEPIGTRQAAGFVTRKDGCGPESWTESIYPDEEAARSLRDLRVGAGLSFRDVARRTGLTVVEVCDLEWGRRTFATYIDRATYLGEMRP